MILTKAGLSRVSEQFIRNRTIVAMNEAVGQVKRASRVGEITVLLSHKHDEAKELKDAIALLHSLGVSVYVDWMDEGMPSVTSGKTAERIKQKIQANKKFILLATDAAVASKWCNWELGYGDAHKYVKDIALLPVAENDGTWKGTEYLQIYPAIESDNQGGMVGYFVKHSATRVSLAEWLRR
jgi:predicted peroxiredoxin